MQIGYLRVSKGDQSQTTAPQKAALKVAGCERFFEDHLTGARWDRPQLLLALEQLRPDDVFVVWKLDRLSRSLKDLLHLLELIEQKGAGFKSLTEAIDTTTPAGRMMMQMVGAFAEFEREIIRERTRAGLASARAEGRVGGRPAKLSAKQRDELVRAVREGRYTQAEAARLWKIHPATVSRLLTASRSSTSPPSLPPSLPQEA